MNNVLIHACMRASGQWVMSAVCTQLSTGCTYSRLLITQCCVEQPDQSTAHTQNIKPFPRTLREGKCKPWKSSYMLPGKSLSFSWFLDMGDFSRNVFKFHVRSVVHNVEQKCSTSSWKVKCVRSRFFLYSYKEHFPISNAYIIFDKENCEAYWRPYMWSLCTAWPNEKHFVHDFRKRTVGREYRLT